MLRRAALSLDALTAPSIVYCVASAGAESDADFAAVVRLLASEWPQVGSAGPQSVP